MKFVDQVRIEVKAGDGGRGCVSFLREKFVPRGGPDGGDGGDGGNVYFVVDSALSTLLDYRYLHHCKAKNGAPGLGKTKHGKNGDDLELRVPQGTLIYDDETNEVLADLTEVGEPLLFLPGGKGGRGNARFATSTNRAPRHAQPGIPGEVKSLRLELKLLADIGLVGLPNAGKSTLISSLSAAKPKIADYPFTTLVPNLGVVPYGGYKTMVMADIPGLIAGASEGQGLGTRFLRHVERTDLFLHLVDTSCMQEGDPFENFEMINNELKRYDQSLTGKPQIVVLTKIDVPEVRQQTSELMEHFQSLGYLVFSVSAVTGEGLKELVTAVGDELDRLRSA
ncbi:GTP-binding protein [Desulfuromusa kysingii]|uniref:GTPase Obg n=1 Tax=Desulfuromusa kysingii TaxID=37625 RepID=A0A1H4CK30_9BACT|nr:GTPase ObgE [Desulfuromusa kysingii]SEA60717.1 GTP-binding protein [Desulfuromusa kysingii]